MAKLSIPDHGPDPSKFRPQPVQPGRSYALVAVDGPANVMAMAELLPRISADGRYTAEEILELLAAAGVLGGPEAAKLTASIHAYTAARVDGRITWFEAMMIAAPWIGG